MSWKKIIKEEEEELPEHVKRARERVKQGLPSQEMPLIPPFEDKTAKADPITDMAFMRKQIGDDLAVLEEMVNDSNSLQDLEEIMDEVADFVSKMNKEYGR